jgi:hypothetical protein
MVNESCLRRNASLLLFVGAFGVFLVTLSMFFVFCVLCSFSSKSVPYFFNFLSRICILMIRQIFNSLFTSC